MLLVCTWAGGGRVNCRGWDDSALLQVNKMGGGPLAGLAALGLGGLNSTNSGLNPAGKQYINLFYFPSINKLPCVLPKFNFDIKC